MVIKIRKRYSSSILEIIKWLSIIFLFIIVVVANFFCCDLGLLYQVLIIFFLVILIGYLFFLTRYGKRAIVFLNEAYEEVQKVIWPTFRESFHTTLIVIAVTIVISIILWSLDSVLVYIVSLGLRL